MEPMLVCLQEKDGVFGPNVQRDMARPKNLHIVCTKSGLMDKQQILDWFEKIYFRKAQQSSVLVLDSWTGYNDRSAIFDQLPSNKKCKIVQVPSKCTKYKQALDVGFNRTFKTFLRHISDFVVMDDLDVQVNNNC